MNIKLSIKQGEPERLYQWDTDRQIEFTDTEGLAVDEVHFSNSYMVKALVVEPQGTTANIPNILLQYAVPVKIYVVAHTENGKHVTFTAQFEVNNRTRPSDYVYTETEVKNLDALEARIEELEDNQISDETLKDAVNDYLEKNPVEIEVDDTLSENSRNPVQNKAVTKAIKDVEGKIPTDYVSTAELERKNYLTQHQDLSGYAKKATTLEGYGITDGAKKTDIPTTPEQVGADAKGTADTKVSEHDVSESAHNDIRLLIKNLTSKITTLLDCDDETLDQTSEIVSYIKSNKSLIDAITKSKVSVDDIVDNLTTNISNKPLSAKQGLVLKGLIDDVKTALGKIVIPSKLPNPQKLTFEGAVSAEYDGSGAVVVTIPNGQGTKRIEKDTVDTDVTLEPNKLYIFPEMTTLNITLSEDIDESIVNEYHFVFQSGATATTFTLPDTINMPDGFSVDANKIYEISILETMMLSQSWAVNA